jgi:hypothetical protein
VLAVSAPVVTDSMREYADAYVFVCQNDAAANGYPFSPINAQWAIREALTNPPRFDGRDAYEPDATDLGRSRDDDLQADRAADREHAQLSGDLR